MAANRLFFSATCKTRKWDLPWISQERIFERVHFQTSHSWCVLYQQVNFLQLSEHTLSGGTQKVGRRNS